MNNNNLVYPCLSYKSVNGKAACVPCKGKEKKSICTRLVDDLAINNINGRYSSRDRYNLLTQLFENAKCYDYQCISADLFEEYHRLHALYSDGSTEIVAPTLYSEQSPVFNRRGRFSHVSLRSGLGPISEYGIELKSVSDDSGIGYSTNESLTDDDDIYEESDSDYYSSD